MQHRCIIYQGTDTGVLRAVLELPARPGDILADGTTVAAQADQRETEQAAQAVGLDVCRVPARPAQAPKYQSKLARGFGE